MTESAPPVPFGAKDRSRRLATLGWAAYLGCSWTWCIGMFLPVLLIRDFGAWGFVIFALPNVIGAAGMGWVLRSRERARVIVEKHRTAVCVFTEVTWTFHLFFLGWLLTSNTESDWIPIVVGIAFVLAAIWGLRPTSSTAKQRMWALVTWCASAGLGIVVIASTNGGTRFGAGSADIAFLAPVCVFGFALCPYLDATFLRARIAQERDEARASFSLGFGVLFLAMILLTFAYSPLFGGGDAVAFSQPTSLAAAAVLVHILIQIGFTNGVHASALRDVAGVRLYDGARGFIAGGIIVGALVLLRATDGATHAGLTSGEIVYRLFMACYGLIFPAYVWLCVIPVRSEVGIRSPTRAKLRVFAGAVAIAAPCYWMGFIERETWWLGPGLFIVLAARVLIRRAVVPSTA